MSARTPGPMHTCVRCKARFHEHTQTPDGARCPDGRRFRAYLTNPGQSFTAEEIAWLDACLRGLRMGAAPMQLAKKPELASIARKVQVMRAALQRRAKVPS